MFEDCGIFRFAVKPLLLMSYDLQGVCNKDTEVLYSIEICHFH